MLVCVEVIMEKDSVCADEIQLTSPVSRFLLSESEKILSEWERLVRKEIKGAEATARPILIDTLPLFLSNLAQALDAHHPRALATDSSTVAQEHGGERARVTLFSPGMILQEYQILREIIFEKLETNGFYNRVIFTVISKSFDQAVQEAMTAFFLVHKNLKDQFVATLTHDLRNPIGAAKLSTDLLMRKLNGAVSEVDASKLKALAERASRNLFRTDRMIQYLLDSHQVQTGEQLSIILEKSNLAHILKDILEDISIKDRERFKIVSESVEILADAPLLRRAIENLISNAIKYGEENSPILIKVSCILGRALFSIHNVGNAIPLHEQGRIFQTFHRSESALDGSVRGWGLGLAFVRGVCEAHGGSVGVDSAADLGTTFTIDFPADGSLIKNGKATD
ncbi:MAG: HAMP domain-containing histidine kinase [Proteobacteria bacterium]|nr:MAG: HAMP domain-containing histidine kinase [Pseudomonadota bacterium]